VDLRLEGRAGRWELRRGEYRQDGRPHQLVVLSDLTRALREEEREAWMRLVRVLSHEINNSLAPIQSIAGSLHALLGKPAPSADALADARQGLEVVEARARSLGRFMNQYAQLARLPKPRLSSVDVAAWVRRVAALETRLAVEVAGGPEIHVSADGDQLDQLLINLVQNATDAALETGGGVRVRWRSVSGAIEVEIEDDGAGLADTANLFVPFFTTKPGGSGIGLVLCRQIAEAHGGTLSLANRPEGGCRATLRLQR
jgi:signal transduction histidine kinase